jgi:hypothetical protein
MSTILLALIAAGAVAPRVELVDQAGGRRVFPDPKQALLVIYEDQEGGKQNLDEKQLLSRLNADPENRKKVDVVGIADVEKWDFWPARKYVLADIQKQAAIGKTTIYIDWKGALRRAWGLARHQSNLVLVLPDGTVRFSHSGPLTPAAWQTLQALLTEMGTRSVPSSP